MYFPCPSCQTRIDFPHDGSIEEVHCPDCDKTVSIANAMRHGILETGATLGGYEILTLIGIGGMGKVYEAVQVSLQRKVALKVIVASQAGSDVMAKRFLLEVRSTASLEHPYIVTVFEASEEGGLLYLAMELVNGKTLEEIINDRGGRIEEDEAWDYAEKVIKAMDYAWRYQKLLHRDIKPANIMVLDNGQVKICDLGIAKRPNDEFELSKEGMAIGTPYYMSPEQGQGKTDLDFRADVYSLGATLYHLITGQLPFPGDSAVEVITKHIVADTPHPKEAFPDISDAGAELIYLMMLKDPNMRHASWTDLFADVERVRGGEPPAHVPEKKSARPQANGSADSGVFRQTIMDIDAVEQELRRAGLRSKQKTPNRWIVVRMAVWIVLLFASVAFVGYQFRGVLFPNAFAEPNPEHLSPLRVDDGTSPGPTTTSAARANLFLDERSKYIVEVLKNLPETMTVQSLNAVLDQCIADGHSPISLARAAVREGRETIAVRIYNLLLIGDGSWTGEHRTKALIDVAELFTAHAEQAKLSVLYNRAIAVAMKLPSPHGAAPYLGMAELQWQALTPVDAHKTLHQGIGRFLKEGRIEDAAVLATALLRSLEHREDQGRLYQYCKIITSSFPKESSVYDLALKFLTELTPLPEVRLPIPETRTATRFELGEILAQISDGTTERDMLPEIVAYYGRNGDDDKVDAYLKYAATKYEGRDGEVSGRCLLALAREYEALGKTDAWFRTLESIAFGTNHGIDGKVGVFAAAQLSERYAETGKLTKLNDVIALQTTVLAGYDPQTASQRLLELADGDLANGEVTGAYRKLRRIIMDFPSGGKVKEAEKRLEKIAKEHPNDLHDAEAKELVYGPFEVVISPKLQNFSQLTVRAKSMEPAPAMAIEFWYRRSEEPGTGKPFLKVSGAGGSSLTFSESGKDLLITQSTGKPLRVVGDTRPGWQHVALQLSDAKGVVTYLNGKVAARLPKRPLASVNAIVFSDVKTNSPAIQNLVVRRGLHFSKPFVPKTTLPPLTHASVALAATVFGTRDFAGNDVDLKKRN